MIGFQPLLLASTRLTGALWIEAHDYLSDDDENDDNNNDEESINTIRGTDAPDLLSGGPGADRILAGDGDDQLDGNGGDDRLFGGDGNDAICLGSRDVATGSLEIQYEDTGSSPDLIRTDFTDGSGATMTLDGVVVANVSGAQGLDPASIKLTAVVNS